MLMVRQKYDDFPGSLGSPLYSFLLLRENGKCIIGLILIGLLTITSAKNTFYSLSLFSV